MKEEQGINDPKISQYQKQIRDLQNQLKQQNPKSFTVSSNFVSQQDGSLSIELSDLYEAMPESFQKTVAKSHQKLGEIIRFYKKHFMDGEIYNGKKD